MNRIILTALVASAVCFSQIARAKDSGGYFGAGLADGLLSACANTANYTCNNSNFTSTSPGTHLRLIGGYDFKKFIGVEAGLSEFGSYKVSDTTGLVNVGSVRASAFTLAARGGYKFNFGLSVFGKLGLASVWTKYTSNPGWTWPANMGTSQQTMGMVAGLGWQYDFDDALGIRMSFENIEFNDTGYKGGFASTNLMVVFKF